MSYIKNKIAFEEPIEADGEYNYVFVVDDVFGPYYDVTNVYSWLPAESNGSARKYAAASCANML